jgi:hypothetical protein
VVELKNPAPLDIPPGHPLASEHAAVSAWVEQAVSTLNHDKYVVEVDLQTHPAGKALLAGNPEQLRRIVMAAVAQAQHWYVMCDQAHKAAKTDMERSYPRDIPAWRSAWSRHRQTCFVIATLTRRALPFTGTDLLEILLWSLGYGISSSATPRVNIARAVQRFAVGHPITSELANAIRNFAAALRSAREKPIRELSASLEQLCQITPDHSATKTSTLQPTPQPAPVGSPLILDNLKRYLALYPPAPLPSVTVIGPDRFPLRDDSPLHAQHERITSLLTTLISENRTIYSNALLNKSVLLTREMLSLPPAEAGLLVLAMAERHISVALPAAFDQNDFPLWRARDAVVGITPVFLGLPIALSRQAMFDYLLYFSSTPFIYTDKEPIVAAFIPELTQYAAQSPFTQGERYVLFRLRNWLITSPPLGKSTLQTSALSSLINDGATFHLAPGDIWAESLNADIPTFTPTQQKNWPPFLAHMLTATSARPTTKWLKTATELIQSLNPDHLCQALHRWFPLVAKGGSSAKLAAFVSDTRGTSDTMNEINATCLRGLLWCVPLLSNPDELLRPITAVALSAYKKVPGVGPRAVKVGNAAVYALSEIASPDAVGQLAMLKVRVRFGTAQKEIEKAFDSAASALGLPRDQIEELGVPSYGLENVGLRSEQLAPYRAQIQVTGSDAQLLWFDAADKPLKAVPAKIKSDFKDDLKDLQQSLKDIQAMLPAQRDRIDSMFIAQKSWPIAQWRQRYLDHPLVGTIARRLIWRVDGAPAFFQDGIPTDIKGKPIPHGQTAEITLWHPVGLPVTQITAWRDRLQQLQITQPFKQAHRELYLLTDAELNTNTYSNRYAAHILRQHQFNALCAARGWKNRLRLLVDDTFPPASKDLPQWGLRAEFWIEGIGTDYGADTNDSGVFHHISTDQVRFYPITTQPADQADPLPLGQIPALPFTEIMRDIDLFVGVASVGNDPTWIDAGPNTGQHQYWQEFSFGSLSATAATRRLVLQKLIPHLKIASRCSFTDRFILVRGDKRSYKIHLGSGNILMEPNDQYLCIVPDARSRDPQEKIYLPFEGDSTLSIILSKAFLLADDTKIKDLSITRQIDSR